MSVAWLIKQTKKPHACALAHTHTHSLFFSRSYSLSLSHTHTQRKNKKKRSAVATRAFVVWSWPILDLIPASRETHSGVQQAQGWAAFCRAQHFPLSSANFPKAPVTKETAAMPLSAPECHNNRHPRLPRKTTSCGRLPSRIGPCPFASDAEDDSNRRL